MDIRWFLLFGGRPCLFDDLFRTPTETWTNHSVPTLANEYGILAVLTLVVSIQLIGVPDKIPGCYLQGLSALCIRAISGVRFRPIGQCTRGGRSVMVPNPSSLIPDS